MHKERWKRWQLLLPIEQEVSERVRQGEYQPSDFGSIGGLGREYEGKCGHCAGVVQAAQEGENPFSDLLNRVNRPTRCFTNGD